jgi:hypothetical protein
MLFPSGCIVADPPQYEDPKRSPPILDLERAVPLISSIIIVDRSDKIASHDVEVSVPIRSDDQGEALVAALHHDYFTDPTGNTDTFSSVMVPPSTLDDLNRSISLTWSVEDAFPAGCHQLALVVFHQSSWDFPHFRPKPGTLWDTAFATWWMNIDPDPNVDPDTLVGCPKPTAP